MDGANQFENWPHLDLSLGPRPSAGAQLLQEPDQHRRHHAPASGAPPSCWDLV